MVLFFVSMYTPIQRSNHFKTGRIFIFKLIFWWYQRRGQPAAIQVSISSRRQNRLRPIVIGDGIKPRTAQVRIVFAPTPQIAAVQFVLRSNGSLIGILSSDSIWSMIAVVDIDNIFSIDYYGRMTYNRNTMIEFLDKIDALPAGCDVEELQNGEECRYRDLAESSGYLYYKDGPCLSIEGKTALLQMKAAQAEADRQAEFHEWERERHRRERLKIRIDIAAIVLASLSFVVSVASLLIAAAVLFSTQ